MGHVRRHMLEHRRAVAAANAAMAVLGRSGTPAPTRELAREALARALAKLGSRQC